MTAQASAKEWYDVIFDHWAQITVLLGIIGFFFQKAIESKMKKAEIRFSRLHENKILEIKTYYKSYQLLEIALQDYFNQIYHGVHSSEIFKEIHSKIIDKFIDFEYNSMIIKLFIDTEDVVTVDEILNTFLSINKDLRSWLISGNFDNPISETDRLEKIRNVVFPETLPTLIKKIEISLRKNFN